MTNESDTAGRDPASSSGTTTGPASPPTASISAASRATATRFGASERSTPFAVIAAMPDELAALVARAEVSEKIELGGGALVWRGVLHGTTIDLVATGEGAVRAGSGLTAYLDRFPSASRSFFLVGVAGALTPGLGQGALLVCDPVRAIDRDSARRPTLTTPHLPEGDTQDRTAGTLLTVDEMVVTTRRRGELWRSIDAPETAAVDMETVHWARELDRRQLEWAAFRVISDGADEELPAYLARCYRPEHGISRGRVIAHLLIRPWSLLALLRLRRRVESAALQLATMVEAELLTLVGPSREHP